MKPALLLLPNLLGEAKHHELFLPSSVDKAVASIDGLIAESERAGRRYLGRFTTKVPASQIPIASLHEKDLDFLLAPIRKGERWGVLSDAGLPCIADPGAALVRRARETGIVVQAFVGPCSFLHALLLSGMPAQEFAFHGYLPKEAEERERFIQKLERSRTTHIFMDAPHKNQYVLQQLVEVLQPTTWLCAAWELTLPEQGVVSQPIALWKKSPLPSLEKKNVVFILASLV